MKKLLLHTQIYLDKDNQGKYKLHIFTKNNICWFYEDNTGIRCNFFTLEDRIAEDNPVRFVDAFVDKIELDKLGFVVRTIKTEGRPAFEPKLFLKIYLYGYLNGIRSSRKLEREC